MKKIKNILLSIIFVLTIALTGIFTILKEPEVISFLENREMSQFEMPTFETVVDASFQKNVDESFSDQFISRSTIIDFYNRLNSFLKKIVYAGFQENSMELISEGDDGIYKVGLNGNYLVEFPYIFSSSDNEKLWIRIENYNKLQEKNPDLKIYLYKATNARDTSWFDEDNEIEGIGNYYKEQLLEGIHEEIQYIETYYDNWEDYQSKNYKTDHHWNVFGAYQGYNEIITALSIDFPEIGVVKEPLNIFTSEAKFYGSYARRSVYSLGLNVFDQISDFNYELPSYQVEVNGKRVDDYGNREQYQNGIYDDTVGINHYKEMFGQDTAEVIYDFGDNTGLNLLVISDSYSNAIKPLLASHFDKTVYIDMRWYLGEFDEYFDFDKYMKEYDFDVVLYLGSLFTIYMDEAYYINNY